MPTPRQTLTEPLSRLTAKLLLQGIDDSGGPGAFRNKAGEKKQKLEPLLEKLKVFGCKGDSRRLQANQLYQYWRKNYFETGKYDTLLAKYSIESSVPLQKIPTTPLFSSPKS
jgi:hypothetical protein